MWKKKKKLRQKKKRTSFSPFWIFARRELFTFFFPHARIVVIGQTNKQEKNRRFFRTNVALCRREKERENGPDTTCSFTKGGLKRKKKRLNSTSHRHTWKKKVAQNTAHERKQKKKAALAKAIDHPPLLSADMRFGRQPCSYFEQVPRRKTAVSLSLSLFGSQSSGAS